MISDDTLVKDLSIRQLKELLYHREQLEAEKMKRAQVERDQKQMQGLSIDVINALRPDHGRASCSDDNLINGFGSNGKGLPRCVRCALLEIVNGTVSDLDGHRLELTMI